MVFGDSPLSLCQRVQGWQLVGAQGLRWHQIQRTGCYRVKISMSPFRDVNPVGRLVLYPKRYCWGADRASCVSATPARCPSEVCCSHWGEASPEGNASGLLACQQMAEVPVAGFPIVSRRS